ncbi:unnamed protein product [Candidula unifasciata]|uniref:G-protein coupled receptors family 1 profile domain-containing protein n=1 Tax=Candidula unifasciata TaxID=100452 RepID=A0A8S3YG51_9EUPU|nr:unnamed protein product [Candidula unifasciata]
MSNGSFYVSKTTAQPKLITEDPTELIYKVFRYGLIPCISLLGIAGNVTSVIILTRRGFRKCSNILLLALSISDIFYLIGINNFPFYIYQDNVPQGFRFSKIINYVFHILYMLFLFAHNMGLQTAMLIPVLITGERILAILYPLKAYFILTRRRTIIVLSCLYVLNGCFFLYRGALCMNFKQLVTKDFIIGVIVHTDMYYSHVRSGTFGIINSTINYMTGVIPICLVTIGCGVIGIQVIIITKRRKQLTSSKTSTERNNPMSKTTRTLLSICVLYIVCSGFGFIITYIADIPPIDHDVALRKILYSVQDVLFCLNCFGDFVIYVRSSKLTKGNKNAKSYKDLT